MKSRRYVIGALSAAQYSERRQACLDTWAVNRPEVDILFLIGNREISYPYQEGNNLYLPCPDTYQQLPQKTRWFCLWALAHYDFEYLLKCDDDTYVHMDRLLATDFQQKPYIGFDLGGGYASGGAGYLLNKQAALSVVGRMLEHKGAEDVLTGQILKQANIHLTDNRRFYPWKDVYPTHNDDLITGHYVTPKLMRQVHNVLQVPPSPKNLKIPKLFHHVWLGGNPLPDQFKAYIESWKAKHPEWEFCLWNEEKLFPLQNQQQFDAAQTMAQKCDILRMEILYRFGGVYLDTDFECLKPIDGLLEGLSAFSAYEDPHTVAIGIMGCEPGHPMFKAMIDAIPASFARGGSPCITTGPQLFTRICKQTNWDIKLFNQTVFYPIHYSGRRWCRLEDAYANHHWAHSWK